MSFSGPSRAAFAAASRTLWLAIFSLLLAVQATGNAAFASAPSATRADTLKLVAATSPAVHVRDGAKNILAAARNVALKSGNSQATGDPPLPAFAVALPRQGWVDTIAATPATHYAPPTHDPADNFHARAPPRP